MELLTPFFYCIVILAVVMVPAHFAGLNKKPKARMGHIRVASWMFGWTGVGWLLALYLAFAPHKPE